jgi:hypothetical protein
MSWLSPLWLAALAALAVPVFIHLRRQRIGRRIQVGSLRHLAGAAMPRRRRFRVREPWILALRCGILALLVLALAGPAVRRAGQPAAWILVAPSVVGDSTILRSNPLLDSLRRAGTAVRLLAPGFPATDLGRAVIDTGNQADLWSLLRAADQSLPARSSIMVIVPAELSLARGRRPALAARVTIRLAPRPSADTVAIEGSWIRHDSVLRLVATRDGGGARRHIAAAPRSARDTGLPSLDSVTIRIAAARARTEDARYLAAAFGATSDIFGAALPVEIIPSAALDPGPVRAGDWTAWLDTIPPPPLRGTVLTDAGATAPRGSDGASAVPFTDALGRPLLRHEGGSDTYVFAGRFNPRFGDLVLRDAFPEVIARIWAARAIGVVTPPAHDLRSISVAQLEPAHGTRRDDPRELLSFRDLLLGLAAALFILERWLAHRRPA